MSRRNKYIEERRMHNLRERSSGLRRRWPSERDSLMLPYRSRNVRHASTEWPDIPNILGNRYQYRFNPEAAEMNFEDLRGEIEEVRVRINEMRKNLARLFVDKGELIDLMCVTCAAQEPFLLVGPPGTAKSDLVNKFCQALGLAGDDFFEYMLTKFTEPSELLGPIDIAGLKEGRYIRKTQSKLPTAKVAFLDEIFKGNSAILNTLLTIINERKTYQDGRAIPVPLIMMFAATNRVPEFEELAAIRDRFVLKAESLPVKDTHFEELLKKGITSDLDRALNRRPWEGIASLDDFIKIKRYLDLVMAGAAESSTRSNLDAFDLDRERYFPDDVYELFKRIVRTLEREDRVVVSDRKIVKLYRLIRTRAFLFHGGTVRKEDLTLLRYIGDRSEDFKALREKVNALLRLS